MADCSENTNGGIRGSYTFGGSSEIPDLNGENFNDHMSSCSSSVISGTMDFGDINSLEEHLEPPRRYCDSEGTCSREECVARIESTLRRNFNKLERRHQTQDGVRNTKAGV